MDRSTNIELDIDHGITLLLCLLGHDPQHDLYYGHGTGAPRAKATYNNEMGGIAPRGPGEGLFGPYGGGMNGGLKDENQDIITIQAEREKAYDIQFMLKYAYGALRNYSENIFINIDGRSASTGCAISGDFIVYLDTDNTTDEEEGSVLEPGRIVINKEVISPLQITKQYHGSKEGVAHMNTYMINEGTYKGLTLVYIDTGGAGGNQKIVQVLNAQGQLIAQLNNAYSECLAEDLMNRIFSAANEVIQQYINANVGRSGDDAPAGNVTFDAYTAQPGQQWPGETLFYKIATSGLLPVIIENESGPDLFYELFTNPQAIRVKLPEASAYEENMKIFLISYFTSVGNFNSAVAGCVSNQQDACAAAGARLTSLLFENNEGWNNLTQIFAMHNPRRELDNHVSYVSNATQILSASAAAYAIIDKSANEILGMRNMLKQAAESIKANTPESIANLLSLTLAIDELASRSNLDNFEESDAYEIAELGAQADIDVANEMAITENQQKTIEQNLLDFVQQDGGAPHSTQIVPIYSTEESYILFQTIWATIGTGRGQRAATILTALKIKDQTSPMYELFIAPGAPFQNIAKDMSTAISNGSVLGNPPAYIPSNIQKNKIPDKRCLSRPDIDTIKTFLVLLDNLSEAFEYLSNPSDGGAQIATAEQAVTAAIAKIYDDIINSTTNPTIEMPLKTCSRLKGKDKKNYLDLMTLFYRVRSIIYLFSIIIRASVASGQPDLSKIVPGSQVINWISITRNYVDELLSVFKMIADMTGAQTDLDDIAVTNNAFVVGSCSEIVLSITKPLLAYATPLSREVSYTSEQLMLENQVKKILNGKRGGAPDDTKLVKSIYTTSSFYNYIGTVVSKWPAAEIKGTQVDMFQDMISAAPGFEIRPGDTLQTMMTPNVGRFFVNNAVSLSLKQLGANVFKNNFCPISSIVDAQTTVCNSLKIAKRDGYEYGIQDVSVYSLNPQTGGRLFTYRVRVVPDMSKNPPIKIAIAAYLQIEDTIFINMAATDAIEGTTWPRESRSQRSNDLNNIGLDDSESPLAARKCLFDLQRVFDNSASECGKLNSYTDIINVINKDPSAPQSDRRLLISQILEVSFRKSLGDYLQELSTVAENGGYIGLYGTFPAGANIVRPDVARLGLHNDRPAFARAMLLSLYGKSGINPRSLSALTVTDKLDRLNYIAAGRNIIATQGGSKNIKKAKTRGRRKVKRGKQTKRNKGKSCK